MSTQWQVESNGLKEGSEQYNTALQVILRKLQHEIPQFDDFVEAKLNPHRDVVAFKNQSKNIMLLHLPSIPSSSKLQELNVTPKNETFIHSDQRITEQFSWIPYEPSVDSPSVSPSILLLIDDDQTISFLFFLHASNETQKPQDVKIVENVQTTALSENTLFHTFLPANDNWINISQSQLTRNQLQESIKLGSVSQSIKFVGTFNNQLLFIVNNNKVVICTLKIFQTKPTDNNTACKPTAVSLTLSHSFDVIPTTQTAPKSTIKEELVKNWLFCLAEDGLIHIWNILRGSYHGAINVHEYATQHNSPNLRYSHLSISDELLFCAVGTTTGDLAVIDLDEYFKSHPKLAVPSTTLIEYQKAQKQPENLPRSTGKMLLHWFDDEWNYIPAKTVRNLPWLAPYHEDSSIDSPAASKSAVPIHINGFSVKRAQTAVTQDEPHGSEIFGTFSPMRKKSPSYYNLNQAAETSSSAQSMIRPENSPLCNSIARGIFSYEEKSKLVAFSELLIMPLHVMCVMTTEEGQIIIYHDRKTGASARYCCAQPMIMLRDPSNSAVYFMNSAALFIIIVGKFDPALCVQKNWHPHEYLQHRLLTNLIMFENSVTADYLCQLNAWDHASLRIHALQLGLRYQQIDVIQPALKHLAADQQLYGCHLILEYISQNIEVKEQQGFIHQLLAIAMNFAAEIMNSKAKLIQSDKADLSIPFSEWKNSPQQSVQQLFTFSDVLEKLRVFQITPYVSKSVVDAQMSSKRFHPNTNDKNKRNTMSTGKREFKPRVLFSQSKNYTSNTGLMTSSIDAAASASSMDVKTDDTNQSESSLPSSNSSSNKSLSHSGSVSKIETEPKPVPQKTELTPGVIENFQLPFGVHQERWIRMDDVEVMKEAIELGNLSTAVSFLQWRRERSNQASVISPLAAMNLTTMSPVQHISKDLFEEFRRIGCCLVYQALTQDQLDKATLILQNLGEKVHQHFKQIAFNVSRRFIRSKLLAILKNAGQLTQADTQLIEYLQSLEDLYPQQSYNQLYSTLAASQSKEMLLNYENPKSQQTTLPIGIMGFELDDIAKNVATSFGFELTDGMISTMNTIRTNFYIQDPNQNTKFRITIISPPVFTPSQSSPSLSLSDFPNIPKPTGQGYAHLTLDWASMWSEEMKQSVLIDKRKKKSGMNAVALLRYFISHNLPLNAVELVRRISLSHADGVDEYGRIALNTENNPQARDLAYILNHLPRLVNLAAPFLRDLLLNELALRGVFINETLFDLSENPQGNAHITPDFATLANRLAKNGLLLYPENPPNTVQSVKRLLLTKLLPFRTLAPFHVYFISYCVQHDEYSMLLEYINHYQLLKEQEDIQTLVSTTTSHKFDTSDLYDKLWFRLLIQFRYHNNLYEAAVINAQMLFPSKSKFNLETLLESNQQNQSLTALTTIAFSPTPIKETLSSLEISEDTLSNYLQSFPTLRQVLYENAPQVSPAPSSLPKIRVRDARTLQGDITLMTLLETVSPFKLDVMFGPMVTDYSVPASFPTFASKDFAEYAYVDDIDVGYYLTQSRPFAAHQYLLRCQGNIMEVFKGSGKIAPAPDSGQSVQINTANLLQLIQNDSVLSDTLSDNQRQFLERYVRCIAILNYTSDAVTRLRRIWQHRGTILQHLQKNNELEISNMDYSFLINLFLSFKNLNVQEANPESLPLALKLLEYATRFMSIGSNNQDASNALESKWLLVTYFCKVHSLPLSAGHLNELALLNDWLGLLADSQTQRFPPKLLREIVYNQVADAGLKDHLCVALNNFITDSGPDASDQPVADTYNLDNNLYDLNIDLHQSTVYKLILYAMKTINPSRVLLMFALASNRPLLAVVAACLLPPGNPGSTPVQADVTYLDCIVAWLLSSSIHLQDFRQEKNLTENSVKTILVGGTEKTNKFSLYHVNSVLQSMKVSNANGASGVAFSLQDLHDCICILCKHEQINLLQRAFLLFDGSNIMCYFCSFYQQLLVVEQESAKRYIGLFARQLLSNQSQIFPSQNLVEKIGNRDWAKNLGSTLLRNMLEDYCEKSMIYELRHLIECIESILGIVELVPPARVTELKAIIKIMQEYNGVMRTINLSMTQKEIIDKLIDADYIKAVFDYGTLVGLSVTYIAGIKVSKILQKNLQNAPLWFSDPDARSRVWTEINGAFSEHDCDPGTVATIFVGLTKITSKFIAALLVSSQTNSNGEKRIVIPVASISIDISVNVVTDPVDFESIKNPFHLLPQEKIQLLNFARNWLLLCRPKEATQRSLVRSESIDQEQENYADLLQEVENTLLFITTELELDYQSTDESETPRSSTDSMEQKMKVLQTIVERLLQDGDAQKAQKICTQFYYYHPEVDIVNALETILSLSPNSSWVDALSPQLIQLINSGIIGPFGNIITRFLTNISLEHCTKNDIIEALRCSVTQSKKYCDRIVINYKVAQSLKFPYTSIMNRDTFDVLQLLLLSGRESFSITKMFLAANAQLVDMQKLCKFLSDYFIRLYEDIFTASPAQSGSLSSSSLQAHITNSNTLYDVNDFMELVSITKHSKEIGVILLNTICGHNTNITLSRPTEVELLIRAYLCFVMSCNLNAVNLLMRVIKQKVKSYVEFMEFPLLVRLLHGIKNYNDMQFIYHLLIQHDRFELLLQKRGGEDSDQVALRISLQSFLETHYPDRTELLDMLFFRFQMFREMADTAYTQATTKLAGLRGKPPSSMMASKLLEIMQHYLDAADRYYKDRCYNLSNKCLAMADLIALQLRVLDTRFINLNDMEVLQLMTFRGNFNDALIVARAYDKNAPSMWIGPLYQQVICCSNFDYMEDYMKNFSLSRDTVQEIAVKYKADVQRQSHLLAFKMFLNYVPDQFHKYEIAKDNNLEDIANDIADITPAVQLLQGSTSYRNLPHVKSPSKIKASSSFGSQSSSETKGSSGSNSQEGSKHSSVETSPVSSTTNLQEDWQSL